MLGGLVMCSISQIFRKDETMVLLEYMLLNLDIVFGLEKYSFSNL